MRWSSVCMLLAISCSADTPSVDAGRVTVPDAGRAPDAGALDAGAAPCPHGCDQDARCVDDRCVPVVECAQDSDCAGEARCSVTGACTTAECLAHGDCADSERCREGRCLNKPEPGFTLERVFLEPIEEHVAVFDDPCDRPGVRVCTDVGFGMALLDFDGDDDLDLFIGQAYESVGSSPPCLLRNESDPGFLRFVPVEGRCEAIANPPTGGHGLDIDHDGRDELLMTGPNRITLQRFYPRDERIELLDLLPDDDPRRLCNAGAAVSFDLNHDGHSDLLVGCQWDTDMSHGSSLVNLAFVGDGQGNLRHLDRDEWDQDEPLLLHALGSTLAFGAADLDQDGLLDLLVNEDEGTAIPNLFLAGRIDPGGVYLRCPPTEPCGFQPYRLGSPDTEFGGYMGSGVLVLDGVGEVTYFSNTGDNRMVRVRRGAPPVDYAQRTGTQMGYLGTDMIFSWGVAVGDYNRDGRDDFMLSQGAVWNPGIDTHSTHFDALFLQTEGGRFAVHGADRGLAPFTHADSRTEARVYSSRALLKVDLDHDGTLEFLTAGKEGALRLHREVLTQSELTPRCTLIPRSRYVHGYGVGFALVPGDGSPPRQWNSQGQLRSGTSAHVVTPWPQGGLRFPSGAVVPFDCRGGAGPVEVVEPEWLTLEADARGVLLTIDAAIAPGQVAYVIQGERTPVPADDLGSGRWLLPLPQGEQPVMLRIDARWVPRWWERP
ncbi:MAG: VCBS repeat-containing protein [Myxococcota bacterium]|nr:VCBS repeat-containing protein [Myxococcota bacterium]